MKEAKIGVQTSQFNIWKIIASTFANASYLSSTENVNSRLHGLYEVVEIKSEDHTQINEKLKYIYLLGSGGVVVLSLPNP